MAIEYEIRTENTSDILTGEEYLHGMVGRITMSGVYWAAYTQVEDEGETELWVNGKNYDWEDRNCENPQEYWYRMKIRKVYDPEIAAIPDYVVEICGGSENAINGLADSELGYGLETRSARTAILAAFSMIADIHHEVYFG